MNKFLITIVTSICLFIFTEIGITNSWRNDETVHGLGAAANTVILGTATAVNYSQVTSGDDTIIVTDSTVAVNEVLKGANPGTSVTIRTEGGTYGGYTMANSGINTPMYVGLRSIWFLSTAAGGRRTLIKGGQGLLELLSDDTVKGNRGLSLGLVRTLVN